MTQDEQVLEWFACTLSFAYFVDTYCFIYDGREWIPFKLWREQFEIAEMLNVHKLIAVLKARQVGLTWLFLAFALWLMLFHPISTVLIFSKRDDEAVYLLGEERLGGMYARLPEWMQAEAKVVDNDHVLHLSNGSVARAFPTTGGDSYTATFVLVDEADLVPDLTRLLRAVKPTIDAGGWLVLISRSDKSAPNSLFKSIYRAAKKGANEYVSVFLPWWVRPERTQEWYDLLCQSTLANRGSLDDVWEQYPATDEEALRPAELDKRIVPAWFAGCYIAHSGIELPSDAPAIPGLVVYDIPRYGRRYVVSLDCAEGLPTSDDSATDVMDVDTGDQIATFAGKFSPETHAEFALQLSRWYYNAPLLPENNSIGYAAVTYLTREGGQVLQGHDGKDGWTSSQKGKVILYTNTAEAIKNKEVTIRNFETLTQLQSIEASTLRAPEGDLDDRADSFALVLQARLLLLGGGDSGMDEIPQDSALGELLG